MKVLNICVDLYINKLINDPKHMLISKTPYRISFFGGGSDYPEWYMKNEGEVLSTTIDKYLYISMRKLPSFYGTKYKIHHSKIEEVNNIREIKHHVIRKGLKYFKINDGMEVHYNGEIPPRSGMGSSSSFVVGFLNLIYHLKNINLTKYELAKKSIYFEQKVLNESVGAQDQIAATYGGFNSVKLYKNKFQVKNFSINDKFLKFHNDNMMLIFTGVQRTASLISKDYTSSLNTSKKNYMKEILQVLNEAKKDLNKKTFSYDFGILLNETWKLKKMLSNKISNKEIDELYSFCLNNGAIGGKILGAGAGGFLLIYIPKEKQEKLKKKLKKYTIIPFRFSDTPSSIVEI